jgi:hypothetical protein
MSSKEKLLSKRKIDETTRCWLWTGSCIWTGHGQIWTNNKNYLVHRLAYEEFIGPITNQINHKCSNPNCFNPEHLYDGTQSDNMIDMHSTHKEHAKKEFCKYGHERSKENITVDKHCKECKRIHMRKYYRKKKEGQNAQ